MSLNEYGLRTEQDALIERYQRKIKQRFGIDIVEEFGNDLYEWNEQNFEDWITEALQLEFNEGVGL